MTNNQVAMEIYEHMKAIRDLHMSFCPENAYISLVVHADGDILFNNEYWNLPGEKKIDFNDIGKEAELR